LEEKMQKKMRVLCAGIVMAIAAGAAVVVAVEPLQAPEKQITIKGKKPARFPHATHLNMGLKCGVCHHDSDHKPLSVDAIASLGDPTKLRCVSCHNSDHADKDLRKAKDVFHARCKTCHKAGYEGKKGPTKCNACHLKKKKAVEGC
jgi:hypothetical protein